MSDYMKEEMEAAARNSWNSRKALREEFDNDFDAYLAFRIADENGQVRILNQKMVG